MLNSAVLQMDVLSDLQQFPNLKLLPAKTLQKYIPYFYFRSYKKNQRLFMEGDPRDKIFFLLDGYVMYENSNEDGSIHYIDYVKKNQMFPYCGIFNDPCYKNTAIAATDIMVYFVPTPILEEMLKSSAKTLIHTISKLSTILELHQQRMQQIIVPNAQERVLHALKFLMEDLGEISEHELMIPCPLTAANISKISGTTRETVSLIMNQLKREGIISVKEKKICFHQPDYFDDL
ncbi:Crp/Fnr family transcriptional regulator [Neobacillus sp. OS1-32]|uniref:Crp/Fnr family transcriptional regulator n=1 Tax=Neobacillus paridis TaxID=2803862 RepID=A0ABS1TUB9_9BACI|nr:MULTISPECIES: Crp/Fnr family transcriptional regulator [Neobacillus]MBL4954906.1 Crp/Fnr family transcriptional regulator [Neobacillus paridis]WML30179.1 Crp/Fnr family transcriptional regulator [Neobacillus sp. OS1-32]